jgi:hypothetical protein
MTLMSHRRIVALAALLPALGACYEYRAIETQSPPAGEQVSLQITDQGRVTLAQRFGPGLSEIQGRMVATQGSDYVIDVYRVAHITGETAAWSGESTRIDRSFVGAVKGRHLSGLRTGLFGAVAGGALYFLVSQTLKGSFSGGHDDPEPPPPISNRIPIILHF